jgi:hypothetical protein
MSSSETNATLGCQRGSVHRDRGQIRNLISQNADGYLVTFPGRTPIEVLISIYQGQDMVDSRALDVDAVQMRPHVY